VRLLVSLLALGLVVELGLVIGKGGRDISEANAEEHIAGYGVYIKPCVFGGSGVNISQLSPST
jgi:hypothetical protein